MGNAGQRGRSSCSRLRVAPRRRGMQRRLDERRAGAVHQGGRPDHQRDAEVARCAGRRRRDLACAKDPCEPSISGHAATVTYRFAGDQASLDPHYTKLLEPRGWRAVSADETDALTLRRSLQGSEALVMVVDVDEHSAMLSVWIAEVPKSPPRA